MKNLDNGDNMNVIFLDYDGVVNTPMWDKNGKRCTYAFPSDNKVNNFQAIQWVSEFCQKFNYSIVVSSSWRTHKNYKECLINGGLREGIEILGCTPRLPDGCRGDEIRQYLNEHPEVTNFIILDDDTDMGDLSNHLIECYRDAGFNLSEYIRAEKLHEKLKGEKHES